MKKIFVLLILCISYSSFGQTEPDKKQEPGLMEKMILKTFFKPFIFDLPKEFDEREKKRNIQLFKSSVYKESKVTAQCTDLNEEQEFFQEEDDEYDLASHKRGTFEHFSGAEILNSLIKR